MIFVWVISVIRYSLIPIHFVVNSFAPFTEYLLTFMFFDYVLYLLIRDSIKLAKRTLNKFGWCVLWGICLTSLLYFMILFVIAHVKHLNENDTNFWISTIWLLINSSLFVMSIFIMISGFVINWFIVSTFRSVNAKITDAAKKEIRSLWII